MIAASKGIGQESEENSVNHAEWDKKAGTVPVSRIIHQGVLACPAVL
jgi:hypothetical protein